MAKKPKTNHVYQKDKFGIEEVYEQEVMFTCPKRGLVKQMVKIKRFRSSSDTYVPSFVADAINDELNQKDDGLNIYGEGEQNE